jgi:hypothetical protein
VDDSTSVDITQCPEHTTKVLSDSFYGQCLIELLWTTSVHHLTTCLKNVNPEVLAFLVWHNNQYLVLVSKRSDELGDVSTPTTGLHNDYFIHHSSWSGGDKDALDGNERRFPRLTWT